MSSSYDCSFLCLGLTDYRTFIDDYLKILAFIEWLKVAYPEKAALLTKKSINISYVYNIYHTLLIAHQCTVDWCF